MNEYKAQIVPDDSGKRTYHIQFNTDSRENFKEVEKLLRQLIDGNEAPSESNDEKLIEAAKLLKKECQNNRCEKCVFYNGDGEDCCMIGENPTLWDIPQPRRFTDSDIALAKALKAFGVYKIAHKINTEWCNMLIHNELSATLPNNAFMGVKEGEEVSIDDIIEQGE